MRFCGLICAALLAIGMIAPAQAQAAGGGTAPEIFSFSPNEGSAGTKIVIRGSGFKGTRFVLFCAGRTGRTAKFKVVSDTELEATAPPYLRAGQSAVIAVVTAKGATVGMPASVLEVDGGAGNGNTAATFYHVLKGGVVNSPQGIVLVEDGGTSAAPKGTAVCFVKRGGTLQDAEHFSGVLIHEPRARIQLGNQVKQHSGNQRPSVRLIAVPEISASVGVEPFVYYRSENAGTEADSPPVVRSLGPARVPSGGILTLHGKGFSETDEVLIVSPRVNAGERLAPFRVVSDKELDIEVPDTLTGTADLVIVNPKGATLVTSRSDLARQPAQSPGWLKPSRMAGRRSSSAATVTLVSRERPAASAGGKGQVSFVQDGGAVAETRNAGVLLVHNGGQASVSSGDVLVFHEPRATISATGRNNTGIREVPTVNLNVLPATFEAYRP